MLNKIESPKRKDLRTFKAISRELKGTVKKVSKIKGNGARNGKIIRNG